MQQKTTVLTVLVLAAILALAAPVTAEDQETSENDGPCLTTKGGIPPDVAVDIDCVLDKIPPNPITGGN